MTPAEHLRQVCATFAHGRTAALRPSSPRLCGTFTLRRRDDIEEDVAKRNLRGVYLTGEDGRYEIRTVRPVDYKSPTTAPSVRCYGQPAADPGAPLTFT